MIIILRHIHIGTGRADGRGAHARRGAAGADHAAGCIDRAASAIGQLHG